MEKQPVLQISDEHLAETIEKAKAVYQSRQKRERIGFAGFLFCQMRFTGGNFIWLGQGLLLLGIIFSLIIRDISNIAIQYLPVYLGWLAILIAMTCIPFIGRSIQYKMFEIEMTTRISMPKLLIARIITTGIGDLVLIVVSLLMISMKTKLEASSTALYIILPFLLTCLICLITGTTVRNENQRYLCIAFCFILMVLLPILWQTAPVTFEQTSIPVWGAMCAVCIAILLIFGYKTISKEYKYGTNNSRTFQAL